MVNIYLLREEAKTSSDIDIDQESEEKEQSEEGLFCRYCGQYITSAKYAVEMGGRHHHTFFNPAGIIYEIRCFSSAQGCSSHGPPSREFTWFAGYSWRLALCSLCSAHMGWYFSSGDSNFCGLIARNLTTS